MSRLAMLEADWPAADRTLFEDLFRGGSLLDKAGPLSHLRLISRRNLVTAYGRWLGWLTLEVPAALHEPPLQRATAERFRAWTASLDHLAPASRHALADPILWMLKTAAPEGDWSAHERVLSLIRHAMAEHRSTRKDGRIISSAVLFEAAARRSVSLGQGSAPGSFQTALARRDAAMVAFLALLPIRRRAFCELELGRSFLVSDSGMEVVLDSTMTKTGQHWEAPVPDALLGIMSDYLDQIRPVLACRARTPPSALWLNDHGHPYGGIHLAARIRQITYDLVGVRVTPHMFRDCAATTLAYASPEHARLIRALLGHSTFRTGEQHYNQARGIEAGRQHADVIARLIGGGP